MEFLLLAASSFGLGALHALEPGHGKTVVGAYLVGSKGRVSDAVVLGLVVTLTHSGSVILLGILSTVAAAIFVPATVQKVLEVVSALLVIGVGGWMLAVRIRQARSSESDHHAHDYLHDHGDHGHAHAPVAGERPSLWQLITLGVSGGVVPCPGALAVLLAAVAYGQFARGLSLVVIFSIGMASVLVAIGIAMVRTAGYMQKRLDPSGRVRLLPVASAAVVTLIGLVLTVKAVADLL